MAPGPAQMGRTSLPDKQGLVEYITELFRSTGKIHAQNPPRDKPTPPNGDTATRVRCVNKFLKLDSEDLAKELFSFMPGDHNARDLGRPSTSSYENSGREIPGRVAKVTAYFRKCGSCRRGEAVELQCRTFDFGNNHTILIHQFPWEDQTWAVVLGTRDNPKEYSMWGKIDATTKQTSYHDEILLEEVSPVEPRKRSRRWDVNGSDDSDFSPEPEAKRKNASTVLSSSKRRRTLNRAPDSKGSASEVIEQTVKTRTFMPVSDDEEDMTISQLRQSRLEAVARASGDDESAGTPVPARASSPPQTSPNAQQSESHDLQKALFDVQAHVNSQEDSDGMPVICLNARLQTYMKGLELAASQNNTYLFGSMRATIDRELARVGASALPDI